MKVIETHYVMDDRYDSIVKVEKCRPGLTNLAAIVDYVYIKTYKMEIKKITKEEFERLSKLPL